MKRRQALFGILGLGVGLSVALESNAQRAAGSPVIGLLDAGETLPWWTAFRQQMRELGYAEGKNVVYESRFARGDLGRLPALAQELIRINVSVIVTIGTAAALAAKRATDTVPIVMGNGADPVSQGLAVSLARPGGNVTGVSSVAADLTGKRLQLLREVLPKLSRLAVLWQMDNSISALTIRELEAVTRSSKIVLQNMGVRTRGEMDVAFATAIREHAEAVFVVLTPLTNDELQHIADLALRHRLPSVSGTSDFVAAGGLASYGPSYSNLLRRAAVYVDKILKGAKPGNLPIEQPTTFELVINRNTAKTLRLTIPQSLLLRADRVIQ